MMRLSQVCEWTGGELLGADLAVSGVSTDTRALASGELFVALRGEHFDGHRFIAQARQAGAVAALVDRTTGVDADLPRVRVEDTRQGLGRLAAGHARQFPIPRVAVTGNAGKTTVKEMIAALLGEHTLATQGNLNNDIGVPLTLLRFNAEHRQAVIELGASAPGEIAWTSALVTPQVALITNVTGAHLEGFGTLDGIARAKAEIFAGCADGATAVVNNDDRYADFFAAQARANGLRVLRVGGTDGDLQARDVRLDDQGVRFTLHPQGVAVRVPLVGAHQVSNALLALGAAHALGIDPRQAVARLEQLKPVPGRMNLIACQGGTLVDDTYNANPGSVRAAIAWLAGRPAPRALVLGALGELGPGAANLMRELGAETRKAGIEALITLPGAESAAAGYGAGAITVNNHNSAAERAAEILARAGSVLIKGSRTARMEQVVERLTGQGRGH